jgi:hypothetical protein
MTRWVLLIPILERGLRLWKTTSGRLKEMQMGSWFSKGPDSRERIIDRLLEQNERLVRVIVAQQAAERDPSLGSSMVSGMLVDAQKGQAREEPVVPNEFMDEVVVPRDVGDEDFEVGLVGELPFERFGDADPTAPKEEEDRK